MKWPDLVNNLLHYAAFIFLLFVWGYLVKSGLAQQPGGAQLLLAVQGAVGGLGFIKGSLAIANRRQPPQALPPPAPGNDQAGFARPQLLGLLGVLGLGLAALSACQLPPASTSTATPLTAASQAESQYQAAMSYHNAVCMGWSVAYQAALALRQAGAASPTLTQQVNANEQVLNTACSPPFPTTAAAVTTQATQVATEVGLIEYILKKENAK